MDDDCKSSYPNVLKKPHWGCRPIKDRRPELRKLVAEQEGESQKAVANYQPKTTARIGDLDLSVVDLLRQLPGIVQVEVMVATDKPAFRIVHLRDWHYVAKDLYAIDLNFAHRRELTTDEIEQLHQELLLEIEAVILEQMAILRCLIQHHGLKRIYSEGVTEKGYSNFVEIVGVLGDMEQNQVHCRHRSGSLCAVAASGRLFWTASVVSPCHFERPLLTCPALRGSFSLPLGNAFCKRH